MKTFDQVSTHFRHKSFFIALNLVAYVMKNSREAFIEVK